MAVSWTEIKKLREDRAALVAEGDKLVTLAGGEERDFSPEENEKFDKIMGDADKLRSRIETMERQYDAEKALSPRDEKRDLTPSPNEVPGATDAAEVDHEANEKRSAEVYESWLTGDMTDREMLNELRDLSTSTDAKGGYAVPSLVYDKIIVPMKEVDAVRRAGATILTVDGSGPYSVPYIDDDGNDGAQKAENADDTDQDTDFGEADLQDYRFDSKGIPVSEQMLMTRPDLEQVLYRLIRQRIARVTQTAFTTGSGSSAPQGVVTGATTGKTAAATAAITYAEIVDLFHSVGQMYRQLPSFGSMMNDTTLAAIRKLVDNDGQPIFSVSTVLGTPDMVYGKPVIVNEACADLGASNSPIVVGAFEHYYVKDVRSTRIKRDPYSRSNKDQVVFHGFHNAGGAVADPLAFRKLTMAAS